MLRAVPGGRTGGPTATEQPRDSGGAYSAVRARLLIAARSPSQSGGSQPNIDISSSVVTLMSSKGWIFVAGVAALALSLYLWFTGNPQAAIFVGLWVPSLWILADLVAQMEETQS
ncbi:hypothetical protein BSZ35_11910 [Salinibacter sp. 10B]|uniref:hypothetical protein n=1 Tax=Salinibacter sp. 10B TaxID=1923971 RepID=UPI000CF37429|nr:hypothetical protein [Salinibacter sp. 10B]PQJ35202.1 hypothetical protein BSZ35_11910 [Salinibacter sp. 10B]